MYATSGHNCIPLKQARVGASVDNKYINLVVDDKNIASIDHKSSNVQNFRNLERENKIISIISLHNSLYNCFIMIGDYSSKILKFSC